MVTHVREGANFARHFEMVETTRLRRTLEDAALSLAAALEALGADQPARRPATDTRRNER